MEHTQAKLHVDAMGNIWSECGKKVFSTSDIPTSSTQYPQVTKAEHAENRRRLVACWNACDGIPTGNLEHGGVLPTIISDRDYLQADRDRLQALNAELVAILSKITRANDSGNNGSVMGEATLCEAFAIEARAALAKSKEAV